MIVEPRRLRRQPQHQHCASGDEDGIEQHLAEQLFPEQALECRRRELGKEVAWIEEVAKRHVAKPGQLPAGRDASELVVRQLVRRDDEDQCRHPVRGDEKVPGQTCVSVVTQRQSASTTALSLPGS